MKNLTLALTTLASVALGAGAMYLLDPQQGVLRRQQLKAAVRRPRRQPMVTVANDADVDGAAPPGRRLPVMAAAAPLALAVGSAARHVWQLAHPAAPQAKPTLH